MDPYYLLSKNYHLYKKYCNVEPPPPPQQQPSNLQQHYVNLQQQPQLPYYPSVTPHHTFSSQRFDAPVLPKPFSEDTLLRDSRRDAVYGSRDKFGQSSYETRSRRDGRPFSGGRNFSHHGQRPNGASPPFLVWKYDRDRYKGSLLNDSASGGTSVVSSSKSGSAKMSQVPAASFPRPPRNQWCELCRIYCSSAIAMEQHVNGKRHKTKVMENGKSHEQKVNNGQQNPETSDSKYKSDLLQTGKVNKEKQPRMENSPSNKVIATPERGKKRPWIDGQDSKIYVRSNDGTRRPVNLHKSKPQGPFTCELCNVKCISEVVFQGHLKGKKHFLKSRESKDASGSSSLKGPSMSRLSQFQQQEFTPINFSELTSAHSQSQAPEKLGVTPVADVVRSPPHGSCLEIQQHQQSQIHGSESNGDVVGVVAVTARVETELHSVAMASEGPPPTSSNEQDFPVTEPDTILHTGGCELVSSKFDVKLNAETNFEDLMSEEEDPEYPGDPEEDPEEDSEEDPEEDPEENPEEAILEEEPEDPEEDPEETYLEDPEEDPEEDFEENLKEAVSEDEEDPEEIIPEDEDPEEAEDEDPEETEEEDPEEAEDEDPEEDPSEEQ